MKVNFPAALLKEALNTDPEFRIAARYWDGTIEFRVGEDRCVVVLSQGEVVKVSDEAGSALGDRDPVIIEAPVTDWAQLLRPQPRPFYQDYHSASAHHGFKLGGDTETLWAYYGALRRTADILRSVAVVEGV